MSEPIIAGSKEEKLWRSPRYYWYIIPVFIVLLAGTIIKFCLPPVQKTLVRCIGDTALDKPVDCLDAIFYGFWLIGPPMFFLIEYVFIFGKNEKNRLDAKQRDDLKYCQELAGKIWAAVSILLSIVLAKKYGIALH